MPTRSPATHAPAGALDVLVLHARGIKSSSTLRILRLLCVVECNGVRFKTRSKRSRNGPDWNASGTLTFRAPVEDARATEVRVSVWDKRGSGHKLMGSARVALADCATVEDGMREMTLELHGGKFEGGTVRLGVRYRRGEMEDDVVPRADVEPGEAVEATGGTDLDESLESDFSGMISVDTSMTPMRGVDDDDDDVDDDEDDNIGQDSDEEDEWRAVLKPSRGRPETIPEQPTSSASLERENGKGKTRMHDNQMFDAWANDSAEDTVEVTPPPMPVESKLNGALESPTSASQSAALRELHTVRHVKTPPKQPAIEAVPESPKRPASVPAKTTSPRRAKKIESEDDLVAALLSPTRRVTFDERLNRTVPPPRRSLVAPASVDSYPKSAVSKMMASPNKRPGVNSSALFAKKLFVEQSKFAAPAAPTRADIDEARRLATMFERADAVFASWSW